MPLPQVAEAFDGLQAAACHRCKRISRWHHKVAERLAGRTSHASAQLVQFAQTEVLGVVHNDSVHVGHVDAALHDGGGQQHVVIVVGEIDDGLFELVGGHLSVRHEGACIGHHAFHHRLKVIQPLDAVVDDERLAVAAQLEVQGLLQDVVGEGVDRCHYGPSVGRGSGDGREVAGAHQRELQRAWNGGGAHGERVDVHFQLFEFLFYRHTEFLLLIDYEQTEVVEFHVFPHNAVRAYEDVYLPFGQVGQNLFGLFGGSGARQIFHPCREVGQAFAERVEMLIGKHCGRHQHSHLFVVGHGLECRADGHFGFAETHVAAHKAVHRPWAFHVFLHGSRRCGLVGGVLVDERCLQLVLQVGVGRETEPPSRPFGRHRGG